MGLGQMRTFIDLIRPVHSRDAAGFEITTDHVVASVRAAVEHQHATAAWVNRAAYTKATTIFRIRAIPGVGVDESMVIAAPDGRWVIDTIEQVGRYLEIGAHQHTPEGGQP
ncbi:MULTISPECIES: head-tail adaptor protein [Actinomycetaceae]